MKKIINSPDAPKPIGPYNHANLVPPGSSLLFVSGQACEDPKTGKLVLDSIENETRQVMKNIGAILKEAGMDFEHVVKTTIYLKDLGNFSKMNEVYSSFFKGNYPARETIQAAKLPLDVNVEISVIAAK